MALQAIERKQLEAATAAFSVREPGNVDDVEAQIMSLLCAEQWQEYPYRKTVRLGLANS